MKKYTHIILFAIIFSLMIISNLAFGETDQPNNFWNRFHVRHNLEYKKEVAQPAFLQLTIPDKGKTLLGVGIGLKFDVVDTTLIELGVFAEYMKNTKIDKEQDVLKAGALMEMQLFNVDLAKSSHSPILTSKVNYKNDAIKNTKSIQASLSYTHFFVGKPGRGSLLPNSRFDIPNFFRLHYSPYLGIEYENVIEANLESEKGNALRGYFQIDVAIIPIANESSDSSESPSQNSSKSFSQNNLELSSKPSVKELPLEILFGYTFKKDFKNTIIGENKSYRLFMAGLNYYFLKTKKRMIGVGLKYVNGEDPGIGFEKQKFIEFGLKFKFD